MTAPVIITSDPMSGTAGTVVTFFGDNFNNPPITNITFGGVQATNITVLNFSEVTAVAPPHTAPALVDLTVTNADGSATRLNGFDYHVVAAPTVTAVSPNNGSIVGGYPVTVTGTGFSIGVSEVFFNFSGPATNVMVVSDTQLTCTVPPGGGAETVDVDVTTDAGTGFGTNLFTYTNTPPPAPGLPNSFFTIERLDNRIWPTAEDCWCVDCGFTNAKPTPNATLVASSAFGAGRLIGILNLVGGQNYSSATTVTVVDGNGLGPGTGALVTPTIVGGVITALTFTAGGANYVFPNFVFYDPENTGSGASATIIMDNTMTFAANQVVFFPSDIGSTIRAGYGVAKITAYLTGTSVNANMLSPIVQVQPDDPISLLPVAFAPGTWTKTQPISQVYLPQLVGLEITGLADGQIIPPVVVPSSGFINLPQPATNVIIGLGFQAQLQTMYLDAGEPTVQGQRKKIAEVTARIEQSAGFQIGSNQPDGSVQSPQALFTLWQSMVAAPTHAVAAYNSNFTPLFTGDVRIPVQGGFNTRGQVALQQLNPLPLQVLDVVPEVVSGDEPNQKFPRAAARERNSRGGQEQQ